VREDFEGLYARSQAQNTALEAAITGKFEALKLSVSKPSFNKRPIPFQQS
jgi:hypothetical protein